MGGAPVATWAASPLLFDGGVVTEGRLLGLFGNGGVDWVPGLDSGG